MYNNPAFVLISNSKKEDTMDLMETLNRDAVKDLFSKDWLTHDAMWYGSCMQELGPEKA